MRSTTIATVLVAAMGTAAQADLICSAPAHGGVGQTVAVCYYSNLGNATVTFTASQIFQEPATPLAEASEFCGGAVPGGQRCRTVANITSAGAALWCRAGGQQQGGCVRPTGDSQLVRSGAYFGGGAVTQEKAPPLAATRRPLFGIERRSYKFGDLMME